MKSRSAAAALFIREGLKVRDPELQELKDALEDVDRAQRGRQDHDDGVRRGPQKVGRGKRFGARTRSPQGRAGWGAHWVNVLGLVAVFVVCSVVSTRVFRWE